MVGLALDNNHSICFLGYLPFIRDQSFSAFLYGYPGLFLEISILYISIKTYFSERTAGGPKSSTFYPTIKPFLSNTDMKSNNSIILCENDKIVNDTKEVKQL